MVAAHEAEGHDEKHPVKQGPRENDRDDAAAEDRISEESQIHQRAGAGALVPDQQRRQHDGRAHGRDERGRCQPPRRSLIERQDEPDQSGHEQHRTAPVEGLAPGKARRPRQHEQANDCRSGADRHRHPEYPAPAQGAQEDATDRRADAQAYGLGGSEVAQSASPPPLADGVDQDGDAVRGKHRAADALQHPRRHQPRQAVGQPAQHRRHGKQEIAEHVQQLAAVHLAETSEDRKERRQRQQVSEGDPTDRVQRGLELDRKRRQSELDDAGVELRDDGSDAGHADDQPGVPRPADDERDRRRLEVAARNIAETCAGFDLFRAHASRPLRCPFQSFVSGGRGA